MTHLDRFLNSSWHCVMYCRTFPSESNLEFLIRVAMRLFLLRSTALSMQQIHQQWWNWLFHIIYQVLDNYISISIFINFEFVVSLRSNLHFFSCSRTYRAIDLLHTLVVSMFIGCVYLETIIFFGLSSGGREGEGRLGGIAWPVSSGGLAREKGRTKQHLFRFSLPSPQHLSVQIPICHQYLTKLPTSKDPIQGGSDFQKNISPSLDGNSWKNCPKVKPSCATTISPPSYFSFVLFIKKKIECFRQLDSSFDFIDTHVLLSFWLQSLMQIVMMWR